MLSVVHFPHLGFTSAGVAPLTPRFCKFLDETVKTFALFSLALTTSRLRRQMHVVCSVKHERPSLQQMAKWRNLAESARCCPLGPSRCLAMMFMVSLKMFLSFFVTFVIVSCSRVCLLVVSRLLGLTLRPFAPVCSCHRGSLTHGRLAIVQEAVRVFFSQSSRLVSARDDMCPVVSGGLRERSLHALLKFEGPATIVKLLFSLPPLILHSFRSYILDTLWRAQNVLHLGVLSVPSKIGGERILRTSLTLIRCVVFVSCTYVITF